jgi:hypothetical protein
MCGAAYHIIAQKGATYAASAAPGAHRRRPVARPARHLTVCSRITDIADYDGVTLALPHLVGGAECWRRFPGP